MPSPAIATTDTSSDQRVERSDQSFVHSERTTRPSETPGRGVARSPLGRLATALIGPLPRLSRRPSDAA